MRQREKPLRPLTPLTDGVRAHRRELFPRHSGWQLDAHTFLQWFSTFHCDTLGGVIAQVVTLLKQRLMCAFDGGLGCHIMGHPGRERLVDGDRLVAGQPAWPLVGASVPFRYGFGALVWASCWASAFPLRLTLGNDLRQEPGPALSLVDPILNQAGGRNVAMLLAEFMRGTQVSRQLLIVSSKLSQHVLRSDAFCIVVLQAL